jgi:hypothetical protein
VEKPDLNVAVVPALDSAGSFVALYGGLFKAEGLNVHFSPATSSETVIAGQAKGQYDISLGNYVSYIQAQQRHEADLYIFAGASVMGSDTQGIYTMPDSKVTDLSDLAGKTVAISAALLPEPFASGAEEGQGVVPLADLNQGGRAGPGQLSGQPRAGRQRGQDPAGARGERHAAVPRVPQVRRRHDADEHRLSRARSGATDAGPVRPGP